MNEKEWIVEMRDFPDYFISNYGRVFSDKFGKMKELKHNINNYGYLQVCLYKEGKGYKKTIHRLMCKTFLKRVIGKDQVDHNNRNKLDNRLENLSWVNCRENQINKGINNRNTSGIKGIRFRKDKNRWVSWIYIKENKQKQKSFKTKEEAITWRLEMEKKYYN